MTHGWGEGEKACKESQGSSGESSPAPESSRFSVCWDVAVTPRAPARSGSSCRPAPRYLYQHGCAPRTARPRPQRACARPGSSEGTAGAGAGGRAGGDRLLRSHLGEGEGACEKTSRPHQDGGRPGAVTPVPSRARRLSPLSPAALPESPRSAPRASRAPVGLPPPSGPASCLGRLVRPSSRRDMPRGSVGRWG